MNILVIVESPTKVPTIKSYLGKGYKVVASYGHVRDLPKSKFGVDIENDFEPQYINIRGKGQIIDEIKKLAKESDAIYLAGDPDREGEAISWHLVNILGKHAAKAKRITFNEITKTAVKKGAKQPRDINMNLVNSQQARRVLDRIVGYKISPLLWSNIQSGLSAGRVQSVTTRLVVDREEEIKNFVPVEYWLMGANLKNAEGSEFFAKFYGKNGSKLELHNEKEANAVYDAVKNAPFVVRSIKTAQKNRHSLPPLITSTLIQEANKKLSFQSQRTMKVAQELYEGVSLGDKGTKGLITYMRTDSLRVSDEARESCREFIVNKYGAEYYPPTPNVFKSRSSAQDAHEAIRPTNVEDTPESVKDKLSVDQYKIYKLIWERFVASQMASEVLDTVVADINAADYTFRAGGYTVKFKGFTVLVNDNMDESDEELTKGKLPELAEGEVLSLISLSKDQKFTQPPARYTEASLSKAMEEKGIGRPSTYTPTITLIISRGYVKRDGKTLVPTDTAFETIDLMKKQFPDIVDYGFTAKMEEDLDKIENGEMTYIDVLNGFYGPFEKLLNEAKQSIPKEKPVELAENLFCTNCGAQMVIKTGRYGKFAACPNYPECKCIVSLDKPKQDEPKEEILAEEKCEKCGSDMVLRRSRYGSFYACKGYPKCKNTRPVLRDTGAVCPKCGKRIVMKQGKNRMVFFSCEGYPNCDFSTWDTPQKEKCPECGGLLLKNKQKKTITCYNSNCSYTEKVSSEETEK